MGEHQTSLLSALVGSELASVVFVADYVQMVFQPGHVKEADPQVLRQPMEGVSARLSTYTLPSVTSRGIRVRPGEQGWRDVLCGLISARVVEAINDTDEIRIRFEPNVHVTVSLQEDDLEGMPEFAMLQLDDGQKSWTVWRPGDRDD
jgi:hypothetical protein